MTEKKNNKTSDNNDSMKINFDELEKECLNGDNFEKSVKKFLEKMKENADVVHEKQMRRLLKFKIMYTVFFISQIIMALIMLFLFSYAGIK